MNTSEQMLYCTMNILSLKGENKRRYKTNVIDKIYKR